MSTQFYSTRNYKSQFILADDVYFDNVVVLLHGDGLDASMTTVDSSSYARTITGSGNAQLDTAQSKFGGGSMLFDTSDDAFFAPSSADFNLSTIDFTIECWIRRTDTTSQNHAIVCRDSIGGTRGWLFYLGDGTGGSTLHALSFAGWSGATTATAYHNSAIPINTWTHVAVTRESGTFKIWQGGTLVVTQSGFTSLSIASPSTPLCVGSLYATAGLFASSSLGGNIDDLRITTNVARYTADFLPPEKAFSNR